MNAINTLYIVAKTTFDSLPTTAQNVLRGCDVRLGDAGYTAAGDKIEGLARADGQLVVLDRATVERYASDHAYLENLLAHELAHAYRARRGENAPVGSAAEEEGACRLVKSWGFRDKQGR